MAVTGIFLRRDTKANLTLNPPLVGELVFATDTGEHGWINASAVLTWRDIAVDNDTLPDPDTVIAPLGVLPVLDGSNLTNISASGTGLEALDEGSGTGWRLVGKDPANYGNIGLNATDISNSSSASTTRGATGSGSFAGGINSTASGTNAFAMGDNIASGTDSFTAGALNEASGNQSTALGVYSVSAGASSFAATGGLASNGSYDIARTNQANGICSFAIGAGTTATSYASAALGELCEAIGQGSLAAGLGNTPSNAYQMSVGQWAIGNGSVNTIFEVGIGTGTSTRANGLEVRTDGNVIVPNLPTSDPLIAGALWNNAGVLNISAG